MALAKAPGNDYAATSQERGTEADHRSIDMKKREDSQTTIAWREPMTDAHLPGGPGNLALAQHHALGSARAARSCQVDISFAGFKSRGRRCLLNEHFAGSPRQNPGLRNRKASGVFLPLDNQHVRPVPLRERRFFLVGRARGERKQMMTTAQGAYPDHCVGDPPGERQRETAWGIPKRSTEHMNGRERLCVTEHLPGLRFDDACSIRLDGRPAFQAPEQGGLFNLKTVVSLFFYQNHQIYLSRILFVLIVP